MINWNGTSSDDLHLYVERYPDQLKPAKKINTVSVPGRNGDLIFEEDAYENVIQTYDVYISAETSKLPAAAKAVASWLYAPKGYARLQDDYDTGTFRLAHYSGQTNIENVFNRFGRATLEFNCKPQRFLVNGEADVLLSGNSGTITNPTGVNAKAFPAKPYIRTTNTVTGGSRFSLTVNDRTLIVDVPQSGDKRIAIDSEIQNVYEVDSSGAIIGNLNNYASGDFPILDGESSQVLNWQGTYSIYLTPRWWTL